MLGYQLTPQDYVILGCLSFATIAWRIYNHDPGFKLPPGPKPLPIIGNLHQIKEHKWITFSQWAKVFGPVFSLNVLGQHIIVLNTAQAVVDLFEKRSNIYSDRPRLIMSGEVISGNKVMALASYDRFWRVSRRIAHTAFKSTSASAFYPLQVEEAKYLLRDFIQQPASWHIDCKRFAAVLLTRIVFGKKHISSYDDHYLATLTNAVATVLGNATPGSQIIDLLPILENVPEWAAFWKRQGLKIHKEVNELIMESYEEALLDTSDQVTFSKIVASNREYQGLSHQEGGWLAITMVGAGSDTTGAATQVFILAMCKYPEIQKKARKYVDEVVPRDRLPTFDDMRNLPYIRALVKEVLRWRIIDPLTVPHRLQEDDNYMGYSLPKGATVIANVYAISRDPDIYPVPNVFRPERFMDEEGTEETGCAEAMTRDGIHTFGHGRRICPGNIIANNALFITVATALWALDIEAEDPTNVDDEAFADEALIARCPNFPCKFTWRDETAKKLVLADLE